MSDRNSSASRALAQVLGLLLAGAGLLALSGCPGVTLPGLPGTDTSLDGTWDATSSEGTGTASLTIAGGQLTSMAVPTGASGDVQTILFDGRPHTAGDMGGYQASSTLTRLGDSVRMTVTINMTGAQAAGSQSSVLEGTIGSDGVIRGTATTTIPGSPDSPQTTSFTMTRR